MTTLADLNTLSLSDDGVWCATTPIQNFGYSDGVGVEKYLSECLTECTDLSSTSIELEQRIIDWPTEYHLSPMRVNALRAFSLRGKKKVLELGAGCGTITRYLGELGSEVDAIEGSTARAALARLRCKDLDNVHIINANFNELNIPPNEYDGVFLIGVMEYAKYFSSGETSHRKTVQGLLKHSLGALKEDGCGVIAIENRLGLKYLLGAAEDHYGTPYTGVYNYDSDDSIRTYSKREWEAIFSELGVSTFSFLYPFPDYKIPSVVLSDTFVRSSPYAVSHFSRVASRDYANLLAHNNPERIFWQGLHSEGVAPLLANSFLIVFGHSSNAVRNFIANDFVHCSGLTRAPAYRTVSSKPVDGDYVYKQLVNPEIAGTNNNGPLLHRPTKELFVKGELLVDQWAKLFLCNGEFGDFVPLLRRYYDYLLRSSENYERAGELIDLLPFNIIVAEDHSYQAIDHEWEWVENDFEIEFVLFRALLYFVINEQNALRGVFARAGFENIHAFIDACFTQVGLDLGLKLKDYVERETIVQSITRNKTYAIDICEELNKGINSYEFESRLYWRSAKNGEVENAVVCRAYLGHENQKLRFDLPVGLGSLRNIRFSPGITGFVRLHELAICVKRDSEDNIAVTFNAAEVARHASLDGVEFQEQREDDGVFLFKHESANLSFDLTDADELKKTGQYSVFVRMDWPESRDFGLFRDRYISKTNRLESDLIMNRRQIAELRDEKFELSQANKVLQKELKASKAELQLIKSSRVWETAEKGRRLLYGKIMGRPLNGNGNVSRGGSRVGQDASRQSQSEVISSACRQTNAKHGRNNRGQQQQNDSPGDWPSLRRKPKISVVMPVFNTDPRWLDAAVMSVKTQTYDNWELCIVDDGSDRVDTRTVLNKINDPKIKLYIRPENKGISEATNAGLRMATGEYIAFMDHDDELSADALFEMALVINEYDADIVYSDEDLIDPNGNYIRPHFKPDYSPDLLFAHNYVTHLLLMRASLVEQVGEFNSEYDGAQDYDFVLRACEQTKRIQHVSKVLYHWRQTNDSTSFVVDAKPTAMERGRDVLRATLRRRNIDGDVFHANMPYFYRIQRKINGRPLVSIVVPFKDRADLLDASIGRLLDITTYENFEIVGVSNNSELDETYRAMRDYELRDQRVKFYQYNNPFNFSKLVNYGVVKSRGDHVVLMNNDIRLITWSWIEAMLEHSQRSEIGAVGGKLYYPDNTVQHAGIVVGIDGYAGHAHKRAAARANGYFNRLQITHNVSAVTGAWMMVKKSLYQSVGGFDEDNFQVACNDVDFCLRLRDADYYNIFTPYAEAYHMESSSRGYELSGEKKSRFKTEKELFTQRHSAILNQGDPFYNPNLTHTAEDFSTRVA